MIDLVASLFLTGWIDAAGKFDRVRPCPAIRVEGRRATLHPSPRPRQSADRQADRHHRNRHREHHPHQGLHLLRLRA